MRERAFVIRQAKPGDADRLARLNERALRAVNAYEEGVTEENFAELEETYFDRGGEFLVGELDGEIIAMGGLAPITEETWLVGTNVEPSDGPAAEITRMRVDPDHQREGYGTRMLTELEERAIDRGMSVILLITTRRQTAALRFYQSFGYEIVNRIDWREYELQICKKYLA